MPRRAYPYSRFSAKHQRHGDSIRRQDDWQQSVCRQRGWTLDDTLRFLDAGVSAHHGKNSDVGDLARFLDLVQRGRITPGSVLLVEVLDRLSREQIDEAYDLFRRILKAGV
jgi:DNA invertase Pin-like site-specific DNA recombinase